jgi:flagellar hook-length control protein FliK
LDPTALAAAALTGTAVPPTLLPDSVPTLVGTTPTATPVEATPTLTPTVKGATAFAPGQVKAAGTSAKELAPGQVKAAHEPAKELAPGHRAKTVEAPPAPTEPVDPPTGVGPAAATPPAAPASAPAPAPVPVTAPVATEPTHTVRPAIAAAAKRLTHQGDRTSLVVRLDPPELGAVLVRMTVREGQVEVTLRAPDLAAQGGLLAQAPEIQQVLKEAGLDLASFDVSYGELTQGQPEDRRGTPDRGTPQQRGGADGTVHVTDDVTDPQPAGTWL